MGTLKSLDLVLVVYTLEDEDEYKSTHFYDNRLTDEEILHYLQGNGDVEIHHIAR